MAKKKPTPKPKQCSGKTKAGKRCKHPAVQGGRCRQHPKPGQKQDKAKVKRSSTGKDKDLAALARAARSKPAPVEEITRANTPEEMNQLSQQQQALVKAIGIGTWHALKGREQVAIRCYLLERGNVTAAAMRAGVSRCYFYSDTRTKAFETALKRAKPIAVDLIEHAIVKRGYRGVDKTVRYKGMPVPITDPRVPVIKDPETGKPYLVRDPANPEDMIPFRGYETDIEYSDTIGLHTIKSLMPEKYNSPPARQIEVKAPDPSDLLAAIGAQVGLEDDADTLDQSYKLDD